MAIRYATPLLLGALLVFAAPIVSAQSVYKWTDEDGNIHYGNSVPPQYADQVFPNRVPQADPADAAARERAEADAVLLRIYSSVEEIEGLRDERLERLEYNDRLTRSYLENLRRQLADLEAAAASDSPDADLAADIAATRRKIAAYESRLAKSEAEQAEIRTQFDQDIARFRELTAAAGG